MGQSTGSGPASGSDTYRFSRNQRFGEHFAWQRWEGLEVLDSCPGHFLEEEPTPLVRRSKLYFFLPKGTRNPVVYKACHYQGERSCFPWCSIRALQGGLTQEAQEPEVSPATQLPCWGLQGHQKFCCLLKCHSPYPQEDQKRRNIWNLRALSGWLFLLGRPVELSLQA